MSITSLVTSVGYPIVFGLVAAESLGIPLPGETALIAAGIVAGRSHHLSVWLIWAVAAAGAIIGDNIGFWIGNKGGYRLARRYGPKIRLDEAKLKVGRYAFDRHGGKVVFFGRFVSVLRTYAAFLAGTVRMRWRRFLGFNAAGGIVWSGIYTWASYELGDSINKFSGTVDYAMIAAAVVAVVVVFLVVRRKTAQLEAVAELAYPGELEDR